MKKVKKKKLTAAQRIYFNSSISKPSRGETIIPKRDRMGVKACG